MQNVRGNFRLVRSSRIGKKLKPCIGFIIQSNMGRVFALVSHLIIYEKNPPPPEKGTTGAKNHGAGWGDAMAEEKDISGRLALWFGDLDVTGGLEELGELGAQLGDRHLAGRLALDGEGYRLRDKAVSIGDIAQKDGRATDSRRQSSGLAATH